MPPRRTNDKLLSTSQKAAITRALDKAEALQQAFLDRLKAFRVLDPAFWSGNFLYIALLELKNIEHRVNLETEALGLPRGGVGYRTQHLCRGTGPRVGLDWGNPVDARQRFRGGKESDLAVSQTIENRDAVLNSDGTRAEVQQKRNG